MTQSTLGFAFAFVIALVGCGHSAPPVTATESPVLEQTADQQAHATVPDGERVGATLHGVAYGPDQAAEWQVPLEAGRCYTFGYAADDGVSRFSLYLWDGSNHRVQSARGRSRPGVFAYCATEPGMYRMQGKVNDGAGHFAVVAYAKGAPTAPAPVAPPAPAVVDLAARIESQARSAAPGALRVGDFFSGSADQSDWYTSMDAGKCYWIIGAGEPGKVKQLYLYLWDTKNSRITESRSASDQAMVGYCAKERGMYKFQAKVSSGSGAYKVGVFAK